MVGTTILAPDHSRGRQRTETCARHRLRARRDRRGFDRRSDALAWVARAVDAGLTDLAWLDRCHALAAAREDSAWPALAERSRSASKPAQAAADAPG
jgi:hypothetical protein